MEFAKEKVRGRVEAKRQKQRNDPPVSLPMTLTRQNRWINFFSCQVLQLHTLEAASLKRLSLFLSLRSKPLQKQRFEQKHLCP
jgi:hypothetical protein